MHPLLYRGRKFDLRVWAAITSVQPLRLYMLRKMFPKVSSRLYSPSAAKVGGHCLSSPECACMHVRMPGGENCGGRSLLPSPYPSHTMSSSTRKTPTPRSGSSIVTSRKTCVLTPRA